MSADDLDAMDWETASGIVEEFLKLFVATCSMDLNYELSLPVAPDLTRLRVVFVGGDTASLVSRNAELLHALESMATAILRLEPEQHHLIAFDAEEYKSKRAQQLSQLAATAVGSVSASGQPYMFPPMNSRERRMLHLELARSGLRSASSGEGSRRCVVLHPVDAGATGRAETRDERAKALRNAFRQR